jgi:hypothetical protein
MAGRLHHFETSREQGGNFRSLFAPKLPLFDNELEPGGRKITWRQLDFRYEA